MDWGLPGPAAFSVRSQARRQARSAVRMALFVLDLASSSFRTAPQPSARLSTFPQDSSPRIPAFSDPLTFRRNGDTQLSASGFRLLARCPPGPRSRPPACGSESQAFFPAIRLEPSPSTRLFKPTEGRRSRPDRGDLPESTRKGETSLVDPPGGRLSNSTRQRVELRLSPKDAQPDACIDRSGARPPPLRRWPTLLPLLRWPHSFHRSGGGPEDLHRTTRWRLFPRRTRRRSRTHAWLHPFLHYEWHRSPPIPPPPPFVPAERASLRQATSCLSSCASIPAGPVDPAILSRPEGGDRPVGATPIFDPEGRLSRSTRRGDSPSDP